MAEPLPVEGGEGQDGLPRTDFNLEGELEGLHEFVRGGSSFMNHAIWLDMDEFEARIQRILGQVPKEVKRARRISREEQRNLADAKEEAARVLADARTEAEELVAAARRE